MYEAETVANSTVKTMALAITPSPQPLILAFNSGINTANTESNHSRLLHLMTQCASMSQLKQIHAQTLRTTSTHNPHTLFLYSRILHFSSLHDLNYAFQIFHQIEGPNSFIWNTLIRACARSNARKEQAILLYLKMLCEAIALPDKHTYPFVLKACAYLFALSEGKQIHGHVTKNGFDTDVYINNSLIHFYASCGCLDYARDVFEKMPERSIVSWNVMIDALVLLGEFEDALKLFGEMRKLFDPDGFTIQSVVGACAGLGALSLGMWAHAYVLRKFDSDAASSVLLSNALVDMYCKCGSLDIARQVFDGIKNRDVNSWNSMILGFAMHGKVEAAIEFFARMVSEEGIVPNSVTFVGVLSACNHGGLVDEGRRYFETMVSQYKIKPVLEHYGCLVDLLARAGLIDEALEIVSNMPMKPDVVIWRSLLDACCKNNAGLELSEEIAEHIIENQADDCSGVYVLLSKVYASANRWDQVGLVRRLMTDKGVNKEPGCSSIEIDGVAHEFFAGDTSHPQTREIYQHLDIVQEKLKATGYVPDCSQAPTVDAIDDRKQNSLRLHSERLAITFGLLNLKPGVPIRVFKNLRVCNDCHKVTKLISKIYNVEIIVRDRVRFHHFACGSCSCLDYW